MLGVTAATAWLWGLIGGVIHWAIAGMMMAVMPAMHPRIPEQQPAPGLMVKTSARREGGARHRDTARRLQAPWRMTP